MLYSRSSETSSRHTCYLTTPSPSTPPQRATDSPTTSPQPACGQTSCGGAINGRSCGCLSSLQMPEPGRGPSTMTWSRQGGQLAKSSSLWRWGLGSSDFDTLREAPSKEFTSLSLMNYNPGLLQNLGLEELTLTFTIIS